MYKSYRQFKKCQATIYKIERPEGVFTIFYSYRCPKILETPNGDLLKFTFEGSRKEGEKTGSRTTTKQCNQRLRQEKGFNWSYHDLKPLNLDIFEKTFFDTRQDFYY